MAKTVNELLNLQRAVRQRLSELRQLQHKTAATETLYFRSDERKVTEPQYDVRMVDKKMIELEKFLLESDSKIKASNAVTTVEIDVDLDQLLSPIE